MTLWANLPVSFPDLPHFPDTVGEIFSPEPKKSGRWFIVHVNGKNWTYFETGGYGWTYWHTAVDVGKLLGRHVFEWNGCASRKNLYIPGVNVDAWTDDQIDAWFDALRNTTPLLTGGSKANQYLLRDVARKVAQENPRGRCDCGKRATRWGVHSQTHTYLVSDPPFLKIGRAVDIKKRWPKNGPTDNPRDVVVLDVIHGNIEDRLHAMCKAHHYRREWFHDTEQVRKTFRRVKAVLHRKKQSASAKTASTTEKYG